MDLGIEGRVAMITGGSRGLGDKRPIRWRGKVARFRSAPGARSNWTRRLLNSPTGDSRSTGPRPTSRPKTMPPAFTRKPSIIWGSLTSW